MKQMIGNLRYFIFLCVILNPILRLIKISIYFMIEHLDVEFMKTIDFVQKYIQCYKMLKSKFKEAKATVVQ